MKKSVISILLIFFVIIFGIMLMKVGIINDIKDFLIDYKKYINTDIKHRAKFFESVISGFCNGIVTFVALFITILHENKKDRDFWERERKKEKEERLLMVRPFLYIEVQVVSGIRRERCDAEKDIVVIGEEKSFIYVNIMLRNHGYGKCKNIMLDGHECSVRQLDIDGKQEITLYFIGLGEENNKLIELFFGYQDIFGNIYLQQFRCYLEIKDRKLEIEICEPLLKEEYNER